MQPIIIPPLEVRTFRDIYYEIKSGCLIIFLSTATKLNKETIFNKKVSNFKQKMQNIDMIQRTDIANKSLWEEKQKQKQK